MNTEARVLAALRKEEPDAIPTHAMSIDANNVDRILGKPPQNNFQMMDEYRRVYPETYIDELNKIMPVILSVIFSRMLKAAKNVGEEGLYSPQQTCIRVLRLRT